MSIPQSDRSDILEVVKEKLAQLKKLEDELDGLRQLLVPMRRYGQSVWKKPDSIPARVQAIILDAGHPLYITEIKARLEQRHAMTMTQATLVSCLSRLVGVTFTRPAPSTFGLIGNGAKSE